MTDTNLTIKTDFEDEESDLLIEEKDLTKREESSEVAENSGVDTEEEELEEASINIYESGWLRSDDDEEAPPKKRSYPEYEPDPTIRKRLCNKLLKRLRLITEEYTARIGQQIAVIIAKPPTAEVNSVKSFGSKPLEGVITRYHSTILSLMSEALASNTCQVKENQFELPPLVSLGEPCPLNRMTQAQLREFIPLMLRYSTGLGKPGWGKDRTRPIWWPNDVPWSNIRLDARDAASKAKENWSSVLRRIITACYKYHKREDLLEEASNHILRKTAQTSETISTDDDAEEEASTNFNQNAENSEQTNTVSVYLPKTEAHGNPMQRILLKDSEGREYCLEFAVPQNQQTDVISAYNTQPAIQTVIPISGSNVMRLTN